MRKLKCQFKLTPEDIERRNNEIEKLRVKICSQVEMAATLGYVDVTLPISEVREMLHILTLTSHWVQNNS